MNISQAKLIDLVSFLEKEGHNPVKNRGHIHWYLSPVRSEDSASFKVDSRRNEWYDYGLGRGGDILDLIMEMYQVRTTSEALAVLAPKCSSFTPSTRWHTEVIPKRQSECQMRNICYVPLQHQALLSYMMKRKIDIHISRIYCCEVHYELRGKHYFGIAFRNRVGGYEVRNPYYKGCIGHKDISVIRLEKETRQEHVVVFEGFMDFLSFQMLLAHNLSEVCLPYHCDFIVLNSINCLDKAMEELRCYPYVHSYLDNDDGGRRTFESMKDSMGDVCFDESHRYAPYNDLNDYLVKGTVP